MLGQSPTSKPRSNDETRESAWGKWGTARPFMDKEFDAAHGWFVAGWNAAALASVPVPTDTKELIAEASAFLESKAASLPPTQAQVMLEGEGADESTKLIIRLVNALSSLSSDQPEDGCGCYGMRHHDGCEVES